jgi:DNA-binding NtrC family response regulator
MLKKILVVDDEKILNEILSGHLKNEGYIVSNAYDGQEAVDIVNREDFDIVILDIFLPKKHGIDVLKHITSMNKGTQVIMASGYVDLAAANEAIKFGALDLLIKPYDMNNLKNLLLRAFAKKELFLKNKNSSKIIHGVNFIGQSQIFKKTMELALSAAKLNSPVLLLGQTGSGKSCFAKFIHDNSNKKDGLFVSINCSEFSNDLFERELFGIEQDDSSNTIVMKSGIVDEIKEGTLFINEITSIPIEMQHKLLGFIERGEFKRVGGSKIEKVKIRIIASSSKNIEEAIDNQMFRGDLYYRLSTTMIDIPSLKEHKEDIPLLIEHFLKTNDSSTPKTISNEAVKKLMEYNFPGNIQELFNIIKKAELTSSTNLISKNDIILPENTSEPKKETVTTEEVSPISNTEKEQIEEALKNNQWNKIKTAKVLGISLKTLYTKLQEYNIT